MRANIGGALIVIVVLAGAAGIGWKHRAHAVLEPELDRERATARSLNQLRAEHQRLLAMQPANDEQEHFANAAALTQARAEIASLRQQLDDTTDSKTPPKLENAARFAAGSTVAVAECRDVGNATAQAALETAMWAGAGGDVDKFAKLLVIPDGGTRAAAKAWWESMPENTRASHSSPERLLAFLTIRDIPLGLVQVRQLNSLDGWPAPAAQMQLLLRAADGTPKDTHLVFMNPGDGWKLVVTEPVIAKYAAMLKQSTPSAEK